MKVQINVCVDGYYGSYVAAKNIPELQTMVFSPLRTCDDPLLAYATGEAISGSETVEKVIKTRKDAAEILARELTEIIVSAMEANDTQNGYKLLKAYLVDAMREAYGQK